jgi:hypothetical protein
MGLDFIMEYEQAKKRVKEEGFDGLLNDFREKYPSYDLGSVSTYWYDDPHYICKMRGGYGDVVIGWEGIHDHD